MAVEESDDEAREEVSGKIEEIDEMLSFPLMPVREEPKHRTGLRCFLECM